MKPNLDLERPQFRDVLVPLFQAMIRNACVNDGTPASGFEDRSVRVLQDFFRSYGIEGEVVSAIEGRGNLIVRIPGSDPTAPSLALMGHMDVVPAQASDWKHDPFSAAIDGGEIWGRGAIDMLCWTAAQAVGFAEAVKKAPGGRFEGDVLFLALADEEAAGRYGAQHLVERHWDKVNCDFMVTELGGFFVDSHPKPAAFVNLGEKGVAWLKLHARGVPGHGSMPFLAENASVTIAKAALRLAKFRTRLHASDVYRSMVDTLTSRPWERFCLKHAIAPRRYLKKLYARSPGTAKFLHTAGWTTMSPNVLRSGEKINIIADRAQLSLDVRFLPGMDRGDVIALVRRALGEKLSKKIEIEVVDFFPSNVSAGETILKQATEAIFAQAHPDARLADLFIGGVTDGRYWRAKGTTVYGYTLFDKDLTMDAYGQRIHGIDERVSLSSLSHCLHYFTALPEKFFEAYRSSRTQANSRDVKS